MNVVTVDLDTELGMFDLDHEETAGYAATSARPWTWPTLTDAGTTTSITAH